VLRIGLTKENRFFIYCENSLKLQNEGKIQKIQNKVMPSYNVSFHFTSFELFKGVTNVDNCEARILYAPGVNCAVMG
jgi:hypothetical protein